MFGHLSTIAFHLAKKIGGKKGKKNKKGKKDLHFLPFLSFLLPILTASLVMLTFPRPKPFLAASSSVKGRVELVNTKLKPRSGRADASGVVLWLEPLDPAAPRIGSKQRRTINQRNKRFAPHVVAIETGSQVDFPNDDPFFHNVFSIYNGKKFDLGLYASGETRPVTFNRTGISYIFCNIHPQMSAVVIALDTPWYAVSDANGEFTIAGVPDGRYRLNVWHERAKPELLESLKRNVQVVGSLDLGLIQISEEGYIPHPHANKHGEEYDRQSNPGYRKP